MFNHLAALHPQFSPRCCRRAEIGAVCNLSNNGLSCNVHYESMVGDRCHHIAHRRNLLARTRPRMVPCQSQTYADERRRDCFSYTCNQMTGRRRFGSAICTCFISSKTMSPCGPCSVKHCNAMDSLSMSLTVARFTTLHAISPRCNRI